MAATSAAAVAFLALSAWSPASSNTGDTLLVEDHFFGSFENAARITVDSRGFIFVVDEGAHSILVFDAPDQQPRVLGGYGWDQTTFDRPTAVATDLLNIYVADYGNHRVSRFDRQLTFLSALSTRDTTIDRARFGYPLGVGLSRQGDLFVLDGENTRVVKFNARSRFERSFGDTESPEGRLKKPIDLLVFHDESVLVLEQDRIVEYDYSGNFISSLRNPEITGARGFCASSDGFYVVTSERLLFFDRHHLLRWSTEISHIVASRSLSSVKDVALWNGAMILLTSTSAGIFRMSPTQ